MQDATDIELHVHTYAVGVADIAAHEGSPHNVLHSSSYVCLLFQLSVLNALLSCSCSTTTVPLLLYCY